ncbi:CDP-glycerol glycerophosphotransferase family protein [bacterium]|nr:CDP-glycerol glycerophosphotransferase family protein [bacterium]
MKILFYIAKVYSIPIIDPIMDALRPGRHPFALFISKKVAKKLPGSWKSLTVFEDIKAAILFQPDFVIVPGNFVDFRLPGRKVQIFHGLGIEKKSHYKIRHFFDLYCTSGPVVTEQFQKLKKKYGYFLVRETGWPKVDYILNYPAAGLKQKYGIPESRNVILYAPTFSKKMQSATDLLTVIQGMIRGNEIWLIKFHELMNKDLVEDFVNHKPDSIRLISDYDITPYLHMSDVLISDTSSVVYEFMILDKPVITYRTISRFDKGINIHTPDELRQSIDRCLEQPDAFHAKRHAHLKEVNPGLDGRISERLITMLENLRPSDWPEKRKPCNGFRKMQILYHQKFKKGYLR